MNKTTGEILKSTPALGHDVYNYKKINVINHEEFTFKAILLNFTVNEQTFKLWVPFSLIRQDRLGGIWLPVWFIRMKGIAA